MLWSRFGTWGVILLSTLYVTGEHDWMNRAAAEAVPYASSLVPALLIPVYSGSPLR